ncbi:MAG TPA: hypothetical protein VF515_09835 [Candidatus Binatia bacterium]|jgi:hypothetical protein
MKTGITTALLMTLPLAAHAGGTVALTAAPAMDEGGLVMLALALAGTGLALLRGAKR